MHPNAKLRQGMVRIQGAMMGSQDAVILRDVEQLEELRAFSASTRRTASLLSSLKMLLTI